MSDSRGKSAFVSQLVLLSKALYHACFICGQRCKWWSCQPKLTSLVISDVKPIIYIFYIYIYISCHVLSHMRLCSVCIVTWLDHLCHNFMVHVSSWKKCTRLVTLQSAMIQNTNPRRRSRSRSRGELVIYYIGYNKKR